MIGFRHCHGPQEEDKRHTHSPGPWHVWPWPSAAGQWWVPVLGQHPSQLTSIPVSELPLHSHSSFVEGHCLQMFPGIECLGKYSERGPSTKYSHVRHAGTLTELQSFSGLKYTDASMSPATIHSRQPTHQNDESLPCCRVRHQESTLIFLITVKHGDVLL